MSCSFCDKSKRGPTVAGHCKHWLDLTPDLCALCVEERERNRLRDRWNRLMRHIDWLATEVDAGRFPTPASVMSSIGVALEDLDAEDGDVD